MRGYNDPMLTKLHNTIRSLRQAQRRELASFRHYAEAQEALDAALCDGELTSDGRYRLVFDCMTERWRVEIEHI